MAMAAHKKLAVLLLVLVWPVAQASVQCTDSSTLRTFHVSANPVVSDLVAIPGLSVGGPGQLDRLSAVQASPEGYREISITGTTFDTNQIQAELLEVDLATGTASFSACTEEGFLVLTVYLNEDGEVAGVPADVLGVSYEVNYANVTERSDARIGLNFNFGGASRVLDIIEAGLPEDGGFSSSVDRLVAELVLTENISNVFDFSESQAPVFGFDSSECFVRDHVVIHKTDAECPGRLNPAVISVAVVSEAGELEEVSVGPAFTSQPNRLYQATIQQTNGERQIIFATRFSGEIDPPDDPQEGPQEGSLNGWTVLRIEDPLHSTVDCFLRKTVGTQSSFTARVGFRALSWEPGSRSGFSSFPEPDLDPPVFVNSYCGAAGCYGTNSANSQLRVDEFPVRDFFDLNTETRREHRERFLAGEPLIMQTSQSPDRYEGLLDELLEGESITVRVWPNNQFFPVITGTVSLEGFSEMLEVFDNCSANRPLIEP